MAVKSFVLKKDNVLLAFYSGTVSEIFAVVPTIRPAFGWTTDGEYLVIYDTDDGDDTWRVIATESPPL
ncbi:hypothetical protein ES702_07394 [subsurface metagenome]